MSDTRHLARGLVAGVILGAVLIALRLDGGAGESVVMLTSILICLVAATIANIGSGLGGGNDNA